MNAPAQVVNFSTQIPDCDTHSPAFLDLFPFFVPSPFHGPYFSRKHIFHKLYRMSRTQDYGLKTCKQVYISNYVKMSILKSFLWTISTIINFFVEQKLCKHYFLQYWKTNKKDETINHSNINLLFYLLWWQKTISKNYSMQGNSICPVVWKCIILKNFHNVENKIFK